MISVNGDPRGVCRGKRGVRKKRERGWGREREKARGERKVKKRIIKSNVRGDEEAGKRKKNRRKEQKNRNKATDDSEEWRGQAKNIFKVG